MALTDAELPVFQRLTNKLGQAQPHLARYNAYYEGIWRLEQLGLAVPPELRRFVTIVNWPRTVADTIASRSRLQGFRLPDAQDADKELWRIWQANDLDEESQLAHLDALVFGRSFVCVGANENDSSTPLVTVESPEEMTCEFDPRTRKVAAALRKFKEYDGTEKATLYLPNETVWLTRSGVTRGAWSEDDRDEHGLGVVPVVPIVNRARTKHRDGVSELVDILSLTDAAARALTNAQVATEVLAIPQRYVLGASPTDFVDQAGEPVTAWETYFGAVWAMQNDSAKVGQFQAADLGNFETIVDHYARMVAGTTGFPVRFFGQNSANPPSEGAIVSDETRLIKTVEDKNTARSGAWETVQRLVMRIKDGAWDDDLKSLETDWMNPATPTRAQQADAMLKLTQGDNPVLPIEAAWEELGYGPTRRAHLRRLFREQRAIPGLTDLLPPPPDLPADDVPAA